MKKFLGMALALALVMPSGSASAEVLKNLKLGGAIDIQANSAKNVTDFNTRANDRIGDVMTRVLLDTSWDLLDDMHANVTLRKNNRAWGTNARGGQGNGGSEGVVNTAANNDVASNLFVDQANIKVDKFIGQFDAKIGRQYYGEPGDLVIYYGPKNTYGLYNTAIDAFRVDWANDMLGVTGLAAKVNGAAFNTLNGTETDIRGIDVGVKGLPAKINAFVYNAVTHKTATDASGVTNAGPNDYLYVYGVKAKLEAAGANVTGQFAGNLGENRTTTAQRLYRGWAALLNADYKLDLSNVGAFTPWLMAGFGTGDQGNSPKNHDFTAIASDFRPGIINGRFNNAGARALSFQDTGAANIDADTVGLTNRVVYGIGLKATPAAADKLVLGLGFWDYSVQTMTQGQTAFYLNNNVANAKTSRHIGYEYGLTADWKHSENVQYGIGYARFMPGRLINDNNASTGLAAARRGSSPVELAFADLTLKF